MERKTWPRGRRPYGTKAGEAAVLERMIALRSQGETLQAIADVLNNERIPPRFGPFWRVGSLARILSR